MAAKCYTIFYAAHFHTKYSLLLGTPRNFQSYQIKNRIETLKKKFSLNQILTKCHFLIFPKLNQLKL